MYIYPEGPSEKKKRFDNFWAGFLPAILVPISLFILISAKNELFSYSLYENFMRAYQSFFFTGHMLIALIPNLIFIFYLYKTMRERAVYGSIAATLIYVSFIIIKTV
jgi:H+/gluconate symporter-like permease